MRVILVSKNFQRPGVSHVGLGVSNINTCKTLIAEKIACEVWQVVSSDELRQRINLDISRKPCKPITHIIISAPWILTANLNTLCHMFPSIHWTVNCHSNLGFLQADTSAAKLIKEAMYLQLSVHNFSVAANCQRMVSWMINTLHAPCQFMPNLYYVNDISHAHRRLYSGGVLRIGSFSAIRPQKNLISAIGAAMEIGEENKVQTEIWINSGRTEGGGNTILNTARELVSGVSNITLKEAGWQSWPVFRQLVGTMHLLIQASYTESFCMVVADGIAERIPSVVSTAIDWAPKSWISDSDDTSALAHTGRMLLTNHKAQSDGYFALKSYVTNGIEVWKKFLNHKMPI